MGVPGHLEIMPTQVTILDDKNKLEKNQLKNIRNKLKEYINKATPAALIKIAIHYGIDVPRELVNKYIIRNKD